MLFDSSKWFGVVLGLAVLPAVALAEDHHHDAGPHGGEVRGFGKYHMEGTRKADKATFYLLGEDGATATTTTKQEGGQITVVAPGAAREKTEIVAGKEFGETTVKVPPKGKVTVLITLKEAGKPMSVKFNFSD